MMRWEESKDKLTLFFLFNEIFFINMYLGYLTEPFVKRSKKELDICIVQFSYIICAKRPPSQNYTVVRF